MKKRYLIVLLLCFGLMFSTNMAPTPQDPDVFLKCAIPENEAKQICEYNFKDFGGVRINRIIEIRKPVDRYEYKMTLQVFVDPSDKKRILEVYEITTTEGVTFAEKPTFSSPTRVMWKVQDSTNITYYGTSYAWPLERPFRFYAIVRENLPSEENFEALFSFFEGFSRSRYDSIAFSIWFLTALAFIIILIGRYLYAAYINQGKSRREILQKAYGFGKKDFWNGIIHPAAFFVLVMLLKDKLREAVFFRSFFDAMRNLDVFSSIELFYIFSLFSTLALFSSFFYELLKFVFIGDKRYEEDFKPIEFKERGENLRKEISIAKDLAVQAKLQNIETKDIDASLDEIEKKSFDRSISIREIQEFTSQVRAIEDNITISITREKKKIEIEKSVEELMHSAREKIAECKHIDIYVGEEEKAFEDLKKTALEGLDRTVQQSYLLEDLIFRLDEKLKAASSWPDWKKVIENILKFKEKVTEDELAAIPLDWREWAMRRFVAEHGEGIMLEKNEIIKLQQRIFDEKVIHSSINPIKEIDGVEDVVISRIDGLVIHSTTKTGKLISAIASKLISKSSHFSQELSRGKVQSILLCAEKKMAAVSVMNEIMVICIADRNADIGIILANLKATAEKLAS